MLDVLLKSSNSVDADPTTKTKASGKSKAGNKAKELDAMARALFHR